MQSFLKVFLWPGPKTVFEIGACEGEDTSVYARTFPDAKFWLFEPLPGNFEEIEKLLARNPSIRANALNIALSDQAGRATFYVSRSAVALKDAANGPVYAGHRSSSLLAPRQKKPEALSWLEFGEEISVETDTLDNVCYSHGVDFIDFIHMDVQGAELKVLSGAKRMLPHIRAIWMEVAFEKTYEGQPLEPEATRWMKERGFRKIHQVSYGPEGDALYYNMRLPLSWPRFIALRVLQKAGLLRR